MSCGGRSNVPALRDPPCGALGSPAVSQRRIGVDVGGSGVKSGVVDVETGQLIGGRLREDTPVPSTPDAVASAIRVLVDQLDAPGPIGVGFPAVVRRGWVSTASNIDSSWIGVNAVEVFEPVVGREIRMLNDADAAGLAEVHFGSAKGTSGKVLMLTFGTGIGSALIIDGRLVPNIEAGQMELNSVRPAEIEYSAKARRTENLTWDEWGARARDYVTLAQQVFTPDLIVIGGGVSKHWEDYKEFLTFASVPTVPAALGNNAGIVGAAYYSVTV